MKRQFPDLARHLHRFLLPLVAVLAFWLYYKRIMLAEKDFLRARFGAPNSKPGRLAPVGR